MVSSWCREGGGLVTNDLPATGYRIVRIRVARSIMHKGSFCGIYIIKLGLTLSIGSYIC